jgi:hypothetical protein
VPFVGNLPYDAYRYRQIGELFHAALELNPAERAAFIDRRVQAFNFAWSHDGKWLALARGSVTNDVVLISDLK